MANPAFQFEKIHDNELQGKTTYEKVESTLTEELIFGICAPIGSNREIVIKKIEQRMQEYNYVVRVIKLSDFIKLHTTVNSEAEKGKSKIFSDLMFKIKGGNQLRSNYHHSILAELAIKDILKERYAESGVEAGEIPKPEQLQTRRVCYIIDSIKNIEELKLLRSVYKEIFYLFSAFSPLEEREKNLRDKGLNIHEIEEIINTDAYDYDYGQNVRKAFVEGDFFTRVSEETFNKTGEKIERYLHLIFGSKIVTPLSNEVAMYQARSAADNSACLSRQVGATITDENGTIISSGWNDVPKFGGNLYTEEDGKKDKRCISEDYKFCSNDKSKDDLSKEIVESIKKNSHIAELIKNNEELSAELTKIIRETTKVKDLIEFSRAVHAEMHAIIIGSQLAGTKMVGGKLFCTTYPCHNCARHIVVAGIKQIYYIEPYVKSLCTTLHKDTITEKENDKGKVQILMYDGVAPRRYLEFFSMSNQRKKNGQMDLPDIENVKPKTRLSIQALPTLEEQAVHKINTYNLNYNNGK